MGIALEALRVDKVEEAVRRSPDCTATLTYSLRACQDLVVHRNFRFQVGTGLKSGLGWAAFGSRGRQENKQQGVTRHQLVCQAFDW